MLVVLVPPQSTVVVTFMVISVGSKSRKPKVSEPLFRMSANCIALTDATAFPLATLVHPGILVVRVSLKFAVPVAEPVHIRPSNLSRFSVRSTTVLAE